MFFLADILWITFTTTHWTIAHASVLRSKKNICRKDRSEKRTDDSRNHRIKQEIYATNSAISVV